MSIAAQPRPSLDEYRAQARDLEAELDRLEASADAAALAGRMERWADLRKKRATKARQLASVRASIAQIELSPAFPSRTFSGRVER